MYRLPGSLYDGTYTHVCISMFVVSSGAIVPSGQPPHVSHSFTTSTNEPVVDESTRKFKRNGRNSIRGCILHDEQEQQQ